MIGTLNGPWFVVAAIALLAAGLLRGPRPVWREAGLAGVLFAVAAVARLAWGMWGPLHINGQGPLWIRGTLDPDALSGYGPGYFELFGWVTRLGGATDRTIFTANALLSGLSPALLFATARLLGVGPSGALAGALVLAADPVTVRTAASEGYFSSMIALVLGVEASLALWLRADVRRERIAPLALVAACLLAAAAARIHPMAYVPLALSPLVVVGAAEPARWRARLGLALVAGSAIGATVLLTSGNTIITALTASQMTGQAFSGLNVQDGALLLGLLASVWFLRRWADPPWLPLLGILSFLVMLGTQDNFQQLPLWKLCYQRLFWPGVLLGAAPLFPRRIGWALAGGAAVAAAVLFPALSHLGQPTTEQLEYDFLQETLGGSPPDCAVAAVTRAGNRVWEIPSYLVPSSGSRGGGTQRTVESPSDVGAVAPGGCLLYVRSSLCTSVEARTLCESVEREAGLERVASRTLPAVPSYTDLPYDSPEVEVVLFRSTGSGGATQHGQASVGDGAAITPQFAQSLYDQIGILHESDGCRLARFDTSRFRITIGLQAPSGAQHEFELSTARAGAGRTAGGWALAVLPDLESDCGPTLAGIERVLSDTAAPQQRWRQDAGRWGLGARTYDLLAGSFVLLVLGSIRIIRREAKAHRPSPYAVLALALVSGAALVLRLTLSPRTFLHEYYHITETVTGYLMGQFAPIYGNTGPALFRLVGALVGRPDDVQVIFMTNAVIASLAIPAVALLDLTLMQSWPRAICAALLLCGFPQHLRFAAAEDLFVQSITLGLWALALFALYVRTRRLEDALLSALATSLAMQTRPEMLFFPAVLVALVLLVMPRSWRVLFAWRTLGAFSLLAVLLVPRLLELLQLFHAAASPVEIRPELSRYLDSLVLLQAEVVPLVYWALLATGMVWTAVRRPGLLLWVTLVFVGYTLFSLSLFNNAVYNLRSQILPNSFLVLIAAGAASAWMELWGPRRRLALGIGAGALAGLAAGMVTARQGFVTELRDQQLEWAFLERTVPQLPEQATLLAAVEVGGNNVDGFPEFLLQRAGKTYRMFDVRRAALGEVAWPTPSEDLLFYQGMFCYFAFPEDPPPDPMTAPCRSVHERYLTEPLVTEDLETEGYSALRYAGDGHGPFRIGFFRLKGSRRGS